MELLLAVLKWLVWFTVILFLTAFAVREAIYWVFRVKMPFRDACILAAIMEGISTALQYGLHYAVAAATQSSTEALHLAGQVMWPAAAIIHITILSFRLDTGFLRAGVVYLGTISILIAVGFGLVVLFLAGSWGWNLIGPGR
jgi:hypothetical protein